MAATAETRSIAWDRYVDPSVARLEQQQIFRRRWRYAGHTGEVPEPGTFAATRAGDLPRIVADGGLDVERLLLGGLGRAESGTI